MTASDAHKLGKSRNLLTSLSLLITWAFLGCFTPKATFAQDPFDFSRAARTVKEAQAAQQAWAKALKRKVVEENSLGMKFTLIPPGRFRMGSARSERERDDDETQHLVEITKPFYIGVHEVTQEDYEKLTGRNPSAYEDFDDLDTKRFPVEEVTWEDAVKLCEILSEKEGKKYRLPTEAEWEYACRAGTTTPFSFGKALNGDKANCYGKSPYGTSVKGTYLGRPTPVGTYPANPFGVFDMHGNVWEFCSDWRAPYPRTAVKDPTGPKTGTRRVTRGGGWSGGLDLCRSADRSGTGQDRISDHDGIRLVLEP